MTQVITDPPIFQTAAEVQSRLRAHGYIADSRIATSVLLAAMDEQPRTAVELADRAESSEQAFAAWKILEHLAENGRIRRHRDASDSPLAARYQCC